MGDHQPEVLVPRAVGISARTGIAHFLTSDNHPQSSQKCSAIEKCKILLRVITTQKNVYDSVIFWVAH